MTTQHTFTYDLYWSPEGKKIATVTASTSQEAKRKAPQPYKKYLGEIYAVVQNPSSYFATVRSKYPMQLLGGYTVAISIRFARESDAKAWMYTCVEANRNAGVEVDSYEITASDKPAQDSEVL